MAPLMAANGQGDEALLNNGPSLQDAFKQFRMRKRQQQRLVPNHQRMGRLHRWQVHNLSHVHQLGVMQYEPLRLDWSDQGQSQRLKGLEP